MIVGIGERIKKLRLAKNMTQGELAERISVNTSTISAYENETRFPSYDVLIKLANIFKVTTDNLLINENKDLVDVAGLNPEQKHSIQDMIETYLKLNFFIDRYVQSTMKDDEKDVYVAPNVNITQILRDLEISDKKDKINSVRLRFHKDK